MEAAIGSITSQLSDFGSEVARLFKVIEDNDVEAKKAIDENDKNTKQAITTQLDNVNSKISAAERKQDIANSTVDTDMIKTKSAMQSLENRTTVTDQAIMSVENSALEILHVIIESTTRKRNVVLA